MSRLKTIRIPAGVPAAGQALGAGAAAPGSRAENPAVRMSSTSGLPAGSQTARVGSLQMVPTPPLRSSQGEAAEQICLLDNNAGWK